MTVKPDTAEAAIADARALLAAFIAGGWGEMHVVSATSEIFVARPGAGANPMCAPAALAAPPPTGRQLFVTAPHVATLVEVAAPGSKIAQGGVLATLSVLDDAFTLSAPADCIVEQTDAAAGALVEYDQNILSMRELG